VAKEPIRKKVLSDGKTVRYLLVVDIGDDPETGKRKQFTGTYDKLKGARAELARIRHELNTGSYVQPSERTLNEELDAYLAGLRGKEATTKATYRNVLKPARALLGGAELQSLDKAAVDKLVDWMEAEGRSRTASRVHGSGHGPASVRMTLGRLQAALDIAVKERRMNYNPVRLVERPKQEKPVHELWSDQEEQMFFLEALTDRLAVVVELFARALRPEEVCGIRWPHVDLAARTAAVGRIARTEVNGRPVEKGAKSRAGERTLPLDADLAALLERWRERQSQECEAAGEAWYHDPEGGYVLADESGRPFGPTRLRKYMYRLMQRADVRRVTPYEAMRHAAGSRMARAGVAPQVIAAWMGHTNPSFTFDNYAHARPEDLAAARDALERQGRKEAPDAGTDDGQRKPAQRQGEAREVLGAEAPERRDRKRRGPVAGQRRRPDAAGGRGADRGDSGGSAR